MGEGTRQASGLQSHYRAWVGPSKGYKIEGWNILPFNLKHDAAEPLGFVISHGDDNLLFVPDTAYIKPRFANITIMAVECNYVSEILNNNINKGLPQVVGRRTRRNHMSLDTLIEMLKANDLSRCREIHLLHLSDGNSDEARMIKAVQEATGIPTYACEG